MTTALTDSLTYSLSPSCHPSPPTQGPPGRQPALLLLRCPLRRLGPARRLAVLLQRLPCGGQLRRQALPLRLPALHRPLQLCHGRRGAGVPAGLRRLTGGALLQQRAAWRAPPVMSRHRQPVCGTRTLRDLNNTIARNSTGQNYDKLHGQN